MGTGGFGAASVYGFRDSLRALSENLALIWRKSRHRRLRRRLRIRLQRLTPGSLRESRTHLAEEPAPAASAPPPTTGSETHSGLSPRISHSYGGRAGTGGSSAI